MEDKRTYVCFSQQCHIFTEYKETVSIEELGCRVVNCSRPPKLYPGTDTSYALLDLWSIWCSSRRRSTCITGTTTTVYKSCWRKWGKSDATNWFCQTAPLRCWLRRLPDEDLLKPSIPLVEVILEEDKHLFLTYRRRPIMPEILRSSCVVWLLWDRV